MVFCEGNPPEQEEGVVCGTAALSLVDARLILIDTNIFLELMLAQSRASDCEALLEAVSKGKIEAVVSHFTVHAVEAVLSSKNALVTFLRNLENSVGLSVFETGVTDEISVALLAEKMTLDFDDALQYYVAKRLGVEAIVSFDKHFDKLDVRRAEPSQIMKTKA